MNKIIIFMLTLAAFLANTELTIGKPILDTSKILLEEYNNVATQDGYKFNYKTSDGSVREEVGIIMNPGTDQQELVVMGSYGYEDSDGTRTVSLYTADKDGYKPTISVDSRLNPALLESLAG